MTYKELYEYCQAREDCDSCPYYNRECKNFLRYYTDDILDEEINMDSDLKRRESE